MPASDKTLADAPGVKQPTIVFRLTEAVQSTELGQSAWSQHSLVNQFSVCLSCRDNREITLLVVGHTVHYECPPSESGVRGAGIFLQVEV